jgi:hypothetical protein
VTTRKTQILVSATAALLGLAVVAVLWLRHGSADNSPPQHEPAPAVSAQSPSAETPPDPEVMGQIREAYQKSLAENAPPGMIELMQGPNASKPNDLPPIPDPFVVPASGTGDGSSSGELPPLPSSTNGKPKPLPPIDAVPVEKKAPKEGASPDLPPLPPLK